MSECSYPYAVSRIKVSEDTLLDQTQWNRLWEAGLDESYRLLHEMGYGQKAKNQNDIDSLTQATVAQARELIREVSPDRNLTDLMLLETDAHNIKAVLKGMLEDEEVNNLLLEGGSVPLPVLLECFEKDSFDPFPEKLREAIGKFSPDMPPRELSALIDDSVYQQIDSVLSNKKTSNALLKRYFTAKADFTNVITVLRLRSLGWEEKQLLPLIVADGDIPAESLVKGLEAQEEDLPEVLGAGAYAYFLKGALREFVRDHDVPALTARLSKQEYLIVHEEYTDPFGIGPIANYVVRKELEARTLRILFAGKRSGRQLPLSELLPD